MLTLEMLGHFEHLWSEYMKINNLALLLSGLFLNTAASAQNPPTKPPELVVLEQYVGNWVTDVTNKPAVWDRHGTLYRTTNQAEMILDGWFLHHIEVTQVVGAPGKESKSLFLWTFDQDKKHFVAWPFQSTGNTGPSVGDWNAATKTFTTSLMEPPPNTTGKMTEQFLDGNTIKGHLMFTDRDGSVLMDMIWTRNRQTGDVDKMTPQQWEKIGDPIEPLPTEIAKLQPFIGNWESDYIDGPSAQAPEGKTMKGKMTAKWVLDGRFLLGTSDVGSHRSIWLIGYDTTKRHYRSVRFTNHGQIDETVGLWNDETSSFVWNAVNDRKGVKRTNITRIIGDYAIQSHILSVDNRGNVQQDLTIRSSRRK
ncbi:MAG: hypothetical protein RLY14_2268 [Planctomycetota bacterium]|jgi:hypothetical protein